MKIRWSMGLSLVMLGACSPPAAAPDAQAPSDAQSSGMDAVAVDAQAPNDAQPSSMDAAVEDAQAPSDAASPPVDAEEIHVRDAGSCCVPRPDRNAPECHFMAWGMCISHHEGAACRWLCDGGG